MPHFFTHYWLNQTWERNRKRASNGELLDHTAGNLFQKRGIRESDIVYVVSVIKGLLYLCGKLMVGKICKVNEAAAILGYEPEDLWEANEHIISTAATPMSFNLKVPLKLTKQLRFISGKGDKPLKFKAPNYLDEQTLRGVRELEPASAAKLDMLLPPMEEVPFEETLPEEIVNAQTYYEGATKSIIVNIFERNSKARRACIEHYGGDCFVCGFNFKSVYGDAGEGYIHVHHLKPLSEVGEEYELDAIKDLRPVCPNCHAIIHKRKPAYEIEEVKRLLSKARAK
jgi:predicted HNH restriction endonuclease